MSLFQSFGQGDFWGKGFAFASPVNDTLDRGNYTLPEILDEDDLLQEIKSMNGRLIEYLSQPSTLEEIVEYLVEPADEGASDKRVHKFPFMACEVICCEVDPIIDNLLAMKNGEMIDRIFSLLDTDGDIDDRLSGYFEKVIFVLLRRKCLQLMQYINEGGLELFMKFVRHLNNYSIMQLVERLFLHQPGWEAGENTTSTVGLDLGGGEEDASASGSGLDLSLLRCSWSLMPEIVDILVGQLVDGDEGEAEEEEEDGGGEEEKGKEVGAGEAGRHHEGGKDVDKEGRKSRQAAATATTHSHVAELLLTIIESASPDSIFIRNLTDRISRLADSAIPELDLTQDPTTLRKEALTVVKEERSSMLSSLTIVEALLSRPQVIKMHWDLGQQAQALDGSSEGGQGVEGEHMPGSDGMMEGLPMSTLGDDVTEKLVWSLPTLKVYLETHLEDERQVQAQMRENMPKLGLTRLKLVRHVEALVKLCNARVDRPLEQSGVLKTCLDMFFKYEWTSVLHQSITRIVTWIMDAGPSRLDLQIYLLKECNILQLLLDANDQNDVDENPQNEQGTGCRRGYMGHLFIMAQAIMEAARQPSDMESMIVPDIAFSSGSTEGRRALPTVMEMELDVELQQRWEEFCQGPLAHTTATQIHPLGGFPIPTRADANKLTAKFEHQTAEFDQMTDILAQRLSGVEIGKPGDLGDEAGEATAAWQGTTPLQLADEVNFSVGSPGGMPFRFAHTGLPDLEQDEEPHPLMPHPAGSHRSPALPRKQAVFALEGEEKDRRGQGGRNIHRLGPLEGGWGAQGFVQASNEHSQAMLDAMGAGREMHHASQGLPHTVFGTFGPLDDTADPGGWADFNNFNSTFTPSGAPVHSSVPADNASAFSPSDPSFNFDPSSPFDPFAAQHGEYRSDERDEGPLCAGWPKEGGEGQGYEEEVLDPQQPPQPQGEEEQQEEEPLDRPADALLADVPLRGTSRGEPVIPPASPAAEEEEQQEEQIRSPISEGRMAGQRRQRESEEMILEREATRKDQPVAEEDTGADEPGETERPSAAAEQTGADTEGQKVVEKDTDRSSTVPVSASPAEGPSDGG